jgi:hypothetical protein
MEIIDAWPRESFLIGSDLQPEDRGRLVPLRPANDGAPKRGTRSRTDPRDRRAASPGPAPSTSPSGAPREIFIIDVPVRTVSSFLVGAIFPESDQFVQRVRQISDIDSDIENLLAIGLSIFRKGQPASFTPAIEYIQKAVAVAKRVGANSKLRLVQNELAYVFLMSALTGHNKSLYMRNFSDLSTGEKLKWEEMGLDHLIELAAAFFEREEQLGRDKAFNRVMAEKLASIAIGLDSNRDDAYLLRATTHLDDGNYDLALTDALDAYRLNTAQIRKVIRKPTNDYLDFWYQFGRGVSIVADINELRQPIFEILERLYTEKKMYNELLAMSSEVNRLIPGLGPVFRAEAEWGLGRVEAARASADEALKRAQSVSQTDYVKAKLGVILNSRQ